MDSANDVLKKRVEAVLDMAITTVSSLSESFMSGGPVIAEDTTATTTTTLVNEKQPSLPVDEKVQDDGAEEVKAND